MQSAESENKGKKAANKVKAEKPPKTPAPTKKRAAKDESKKKPTKKEIEVQTFVAEISKKEDGKIAQLQLLVVPGSSTGSSTSKAVSPLQQSQVILTRYKPNRHTLLFIRVVRFVSHPLS